jgi:hypothetical protein
MSLFAIFPLLFFLSKLLHVQVAKATVQVLKRPSGFGALLGKPSSGRKPNIFPGFSSEQVLPCSCFISFSSLSLTIDLRSEDVVILY